MIACYSNRANVDYQTMNIDRAKYASLKASSNHRGTTAAAMPATARTINNRDGSGRKFF